jgi:hypothetical protein
MMQQRLKAGCPELLSASRYGDGGLKVSHKNIYIAYYNIFETRIIMMIIFMIQQD